MVLPAKRPQPTQEDSAASAPVISLRDLKTRCSTCSMREVCLPLGMSPDDVRKVDALIGKRLKLRKGERLYRTGEIFTAIYVPRVGSLKTTIISEDGREQVAGFHMQGEIIGLDGLGGDVMVCDAVALEDSEVCVIPFEKLETLAHDLPSLQRNLYRFLSSEIGRDHRHLLLLGSMRAEERLAVFLVSLADRYRARGYSPTEFVLRLTREEIGSYIGLKLETVSRLFSRFHEEGVLQVQGRTVKILDAAGLRAIIGSSVD